ncbi:N-TERMINAL ACETYLTRANSFERASE [Ceraceosorus bombacis]|uniref:N-TERMINAL ACETYLTRANSFERASE n=1 Tax=Ceraceosorus bombacis TaxID=401625 RepID=A0A0P1BKZ0_9BASI|nr:N-TERMINAL ACETYLTRANSFERASE [Ceraceosorus bombacis]
MVEKALAVRLEVFCDEQGYDPNTDVDDRERISAHFILHKKSTPEHAEGTIRITPYPIPPSPEEKGDKFPAGFKSPKDDQLSESFRKTARGGDPKAGAKISRVAIAKEARGLGLGSTMMQAVEDWLLQVLQGDSNEPALPSVELVLSAQVIAKGFYDKLGFKSDNVVYDEEGEPHQWYTKQVSLR